MKLDRYAIDYEDQVAFKVVTGKWCRATDIFYLEQHIEHLEKALQQIKDHQEFNVKGIGHKLSTTWNIANNALKRSCNG
ncbi:MAG: hypothetical protein V3V74_07745 [Nitrosomonadaceae bacterium]